MNPSVFLFGIAFLILSCGDQPTPVAPPPLSKTVTDCSLAEILAETCGDTADPTLDEVPEGYESPVDTTIAGVTETDSTVAVIDTSAVDTAAVVAEVDTVMSPQGIGDPFNIQPNEQRFSRTSSFGLHVELTLFDSLFVPVEDVYLCPACRKTSNMLRWARIKMTNKSSDEITAPDVYIQTMRDGEFAYWTTGREGGHMYGRPPTGYSIWLYPGETRTYTPYFGELKYTNYPHDNDNLIHIGREGTCYRFLIVHDFMSQYDDPKVWAEPSTCDP